MRGPDGATSVSTSRLIKRRGPQSLFVVRLKAFRRLVCSAAVQPPPVRNRQNAFRGEISRLCSTRKTVSTRVCYGSFDLFNCCWDQRHSSSRLQNRSPGPALITTESSGGKCQGFLSFSCKQSETMSGCLCRSTT